MVGFILGIVGLIVFIFVPSMLYFDRKHRERRHDNGEEK